MPFSCALLEDTIPRMTIRTKIVATVGPASSDAKTIHRMVEAGVDVLRVNFSHGNNDQREKLLETIRQVERETGSPLAILADLCGPKIRVREIEGGAVLLSDGQEIAIQRESILGRSDRISTTLEELASHASVGETLLLDDGKIRLEITDVLPPEEVRCRVARGGILASSKGMNLPHTKLSISPLTEKDRRDVEWIAKHDFDFVALSFVQRAEDITTLRELLQRNGCDAHIVAKIEKPQAMQNIEDIIDVTDVVMVARGDLGVEMDLPAVPVAQKRIARLCQQAGTPCIIATQMLESMTTSAVPTRAEVSDVANAVLDLADAVMLSGETAVGKYAVESVDMMNRIVAEMQAYHDEMARPLPPVRAKEITTAALARTVREIISTEPIAALAIFTATGSTVRMFSKQRPACPILGLSPSPSAVRRMCLYYGVHGVYAETPEHTRDVLEVAERFAKQNNIAKPGEKIIVVSGRPLGKPGCTNTLVVHTVE